MSYKLEYDHKSFTVQGKRKFLHCASIHYFRFPREEWREVLWKAKLAGIECIDTYFAWNVHEPIENVWDFSGNLDCDAYLSLCEELGLQVIARPGPYICAEWDFGGFPGWLADKEGIQFRSFEPTFLHYVDLYFDKIVPIISRHLTTKGGGVVLVQVENEFAHLGTDMEGSDYLNYLRDGLIRRGIDVPLISCEGGIEGTIEAANFWSGADDHYDKLRNKQPDTPKIVTEFWTGWFEKWGGTRANHKTADMLERRMMEALRAGFTGITHYMFCGGTNFGDFGGRTVGGSNVFMVTSYDYDAPLGEYLQITPKYGAVKRMGYFIQTIAPFLMESEECECSVRVKGNGSIRVRSHGDTSIYFVEQHADERGDIYFTNEHGMTYMVTANPGQIAPVIVNFPILLGWKLSYNSFFGGFHEIDGVPTLVVFGDEGQRSCLRIKTSGELVVQTPSSIIVTRCKETGETIAELCHFQECQTIRLEDGEQQLRIIVLSTQMMEKTWWLLDQEHSLLIGASSLDFNSGAPIVLQDNPHEAKITCFGAGPKPAYFSTAGQPLRPIQLQHWEWHREQLAEGDIKLGNGSIVPGNEGFGYVWHSAVLHSTIRRETKLVFPTTQDPFRIFVNGQQVAMVRDTFGTAVDVQLESGPNHISLLVQHMGRFNFSFYLGEKKGVYGPVYQDGSQVDFRMNWRTPDDRIVRLDQVNEELDEGTMISRTFERSANHCYMLTGVISERIRVNGQDIEMGPYRNWYRIASLDLSPYLLEGENCIEMAYYDSPIDRLDLIGFHSERHIENWDTHPVAIPTGTAEWMDVKDTKSHVGEPAWYRCQFSRPSLPSEIQAKLKLRLSGMSKGSIWVNGYSVGRYWQIGPQEDYKVPIEWLVQDNELLIFDEEGCSPEHIEWLWTDVKYAVGLQVQHILDMRNAIQAN